MANVRFDWGGRPEDWRRRCTVWRFRVASDEDVRAGYDPWAVVGIDPRPATVEDLMRYAAAPGHPAALTIQFTRYGEDDVARFRKIGACAGLQGVYFEHRGEKTFMKVEEFPAMHAGHSTTINGDTGGFTGLHADDDMQLPSRERNGALPRKLGVALGPGDHEIGWAFADELDRLGTRVRTRDLHDMVTAGVEFTGISTRLAAGMGWVGPSAETGHFGASCGEASAEAFCIAHWPRRAFPPILP